MCGIVAMFSKTEPIREDELQRATRTLDHRGPDGHGLWLSPARRVGLGHTRLSIIDLQTGDQPLANEDGTVHAVVNGELYDFVRLRRELEGRGHRFKTRSDSEILLHLYEDLGANALHQLRGEFALALWDDAAQVLFAARDRFGIKPLYYARHNDTLYLASEIKALLAAGVPARWDHESLLQVTQMFCFHQDRTLFEGIYQVPPGHYLWATRNQVRLIRYWDFDYPRAEAIGREPRDHAAEFRAVFDEAVRLRMHADVPVGCYLSGGLDSCATLGLAARHASAPIKAFTISFDHEDYDERAIAQEMAAHAGVDFHPIEMRRETLADHFSEALWHSETMFINAHGVAKFMLSRAVRAAGIKVVLTGEGADEILAGYPWFRRDMLLHAPPTSGRGDVHRELAILQEKNKVLDGLLIAGTEVPLLGSLGRILGFVPSWLEPFAATFSTFAQVFSPSFAEEVRGRDTYRDFLAGLDVAGQLTGRDVINQSMYTWSKIILPNYILNVLGDRMEMANSVEGRVPFLDHHVVEVARRLPISQKIHDMTEKYVLREAVRPVITDTVYRRQKHPFLAPPALLDPRSRLFELVQDTLRGPALAALPFFAPAQVRALLDSVASLETPARAAFDAPLMLILSACLLQQRFGMSAGG